MSFDQKKDFLIDAVWATNALVKEGWMASKDQNIVLSVSREPKHEHWHPFQVIQHCGIVNQKNTARTLDLVTLTDWLADKSGLPLFHIDPLKVDVQKVTGLMSFAFAKRHQVLVVKVRGKEVVVATAQPFYREWESGLSQVLPDKIFKLVVANPSDIQRYRQEFYNLAKSVHGASSEHSDGGTGKVTNFEQLIEIGELRSVDANDQHIVNIVDWLLQYAYEQRASDIHIEPRREVGNIRLRIDGVLHDIYAMPALVMSAMTSRLKILGRLDVAEKRRPQDGRIKTKNADGAEVELRISTLPTAFGEKMVMRIFDPDVLVRSFQELGFSEAERQCWSSLIERKHGMVLVTGPTGSGKTTTLYSTLKLLSGEAVNVCTLEDPIEMVEPSFNQVQIQTHLGLGFAEGIRSLLRQDPDIIMVGEIRDLETAQMAIQAALTGHLVISTLHTNDAPSAIIRLLDLGVPPYLINATVIGVMAQRLIRALCPHCKGPVSIEPNVWKMLVQPWQIPIPEQIHAAKGCKECRDTGYRGRLGVYELLPFNDPIKTLINQGASLPDITRGAYRQGMVPLRVNACEKISHGECSPEEVLRVTPDLEFKPN